MFVASACARQLNALGVKIVGMQSEVPDLEKYKAEQVFECDPPLARTLKACTQTWTGIRRRAQNYEIRYALTNACMLCLFAFMVWQVRHCHKDADFEKLDNDPVYKLNCARLEKIK